MDLWTKYTLMKLKNGKSIGYWTRQATTLTTICRPSSRLLPSVLLCRTLKIRRAAIIVNSKTRQGGLNGISSVKIAEKVRLLSKRCRNCVSSPHVPFISHYCVFRQNIRLFSLSLEHIYLYWAFITCPVNRFILWDEFSVEKSVIWAVSVKRRLQTADRG